jgi:hypothetical protein
VKNPNAKSVGVGCVSTRRTAGATPTLAGFGHVATSGLPATAGRSTAVRSAANVIKAGKPDGGLDGRRRRIGGLRPGSRGRHPAANQAVHAVEAWASATWVMSGELLALP